MSEKKFTEMTDTELWEDFKDTEYKGTAMSQLIRMIANTDPRWCCKQINKRPRPYLIFEDGTQMRIHFCPRCGREL